MGENMPLTILSSSKKSSRNYENLPGDDKLGVQNRVSLDPTIDDSNSNQESIRRTSSEERMRARSLPVRGSSGSTIPAPTSSSVDGGHERMPPISSQNASNNSWKTTRSRSLETGLHKKTDKTPVVTRHMLFKEAMYTSFHMLGHPTNRYPSNKEDLSVYSQLTFSLDEKEQVAVREHILGEALPLTLVNTVVKRGEHLARRNPQTLADTYCFVGLETMDSLDRDDWKSIKMGSPKRPKNPLGKEGQRPLAENRHNQIYTQLPKHVRTTVQLKTTNPIWEQRFQSIALRPSVDTLTVEVWDHDDNKFVLQSIKNAKDAKKIHAVREGLDDASRHGKKDVFMGKVTLKIKDIPVTGVEKWFNLTGKTHKGDNAAGRILLQIWLTHAYRHGMHYQECAEPKVMLEKFWDYILQLESDKYGVEWNGSIPTAANCLIFQYGLQCGLSEATQAIIRWNAYAKHHLGLYGVGPRLTELDSVLNQIEQDESDRIRNSELETSMVVLCIEKLCPVIRNHLRETQNRVQESLKSIKHCRSILSRYKSEAAIARIDWLVDASLRMAILEWYDAKYEEIVHSQNLKKQHELVGGVVSVINKVNSLMGEGQSKWKPLFWMEASVSYMPVVYDEFQKMIIHDVETLAGSILQHPLYRNNDKLRMMLLEWYPSSRAYEHGWAVCQSLFKLFLETQIFVTAQDDIFEEGLTSPYVELNDYHLWFRPVLVMWLGYTFIKSCEMTTTAIKLDDVTTDIFVKVSSSAVDTAVIFQQLANFWKELNWPDAAESYVILHFVIDMMCRVALLYTHLHKKKLSAQGYFDTEDRFDISDRLCTAFNNIEYVKDAAMKVPSNLQVNQLLTDLETILGETTGKEYRRNFDETFTQSEQRIEKLFQEILNGVASRVRPEIHNALKISLTRLIKGEDISLTLDPLLSYLEDNLVVLDRALLELNFMRFLKMFWTLTCEQICVVVKSFDLESATDQHNFSTKIQHILQDIIVFFKGGLNDDELNGPEYKAVANLLTMLSADTLDLIDLYYNERSFEQMDLTGDAQNGTLTVHVSFFNGKLSIHIIRAQKLRAMDSAGFLIFKKKATSDPVVKVELLPEINFYQPYMAKTATKWKTLSPEFDEKFVWAVSLAECQDSFIRFTCKDYDIITKNDFLGEALVPLAKIPGVNEHGAIPQPMTLQLRVADPNNPIITTLKSRHWDNTAQKFVNEQMERMI